jgi:predicted NBD/HSP70 family sugar kinase
MQFNGNEPDLSPADLRGGDRSGLRQYNERVIMHVIRRAGGLPKAEIARMIGLSPQAVSVNVNRMLAEGLLVKTTRLKGKVGHPSTVIQLNREGAFAVGVSIGRRSLDILRMDLDGGISRRVRHTYKYPVPSFIFREIARGIDFVCEELNAAQRKRLKGIGIAAPSGLDGWAEELEAPPEKLAEWRNIDIAAQVSALTSLPVHFMNDVAAGTAAELALGSAVTADHCLYIYIGTFVGGGLILDGQLNTGTRSNACAIGSLPVSGIHDMKDGRKPEQLIRRASLIFLERELETAGFDLEHLWDPKGPAPEAAAIYETWQTEAVETLAYAIGSAISIFDFPLVVIDGSLPGHEVARFVQRTDQALDRLNLTGLIRPRLAVGTLGTDASVIGAGLMPINANFAPDRALMLKLAIEAA